MDIGSPEEGAIKHSLSADLRFFESGICARRQPGAAVRLRPDHLFRHFGNRVRRSLRGAALSFARPIV
ncbi:MAG: hypothetical protein B7Z45_08360 [Azorhizobium sp. 12-66-6]|nr:MAG: hypothetical protein B7Z45_08360 [Azorhizobium sp. 12-66-6]